MRSILVVAVLSLASGCLWATKTSDISTRLAAKAVLDDHGHPIGGAVQASASMAGLYLGTELGGRSVDLAPATDPMAPPTPARDYVDLGLDLFVRASLPGVVPSDHKLERYLDFGAEAGVGFGGVAWSGTSVGDQENGFVGGWVEIGTFQHGSHYVAIVGDIRMIGYSNDWADQVVIGVGLAWASRHTVKAEDLTWRD